MSTVREAIEARINEAKTLLESSEEDQQAKGEALIAEVFGFMAAAARGVAEIEVEHVLDDDAREDLVNMAEALESYQAELEDGDDDDEDDDTSGTDGE